MTERRDAPSLLQQVRAHAKARDSIAWSGQARQLLLWAADTIEAANAALRSERAALTDEQIMNAACTAADALDATRVSEMVPGGWKATTIFDGDAGLLRFGRLIEAALKNAAPQVPASVRPGERPIASSPAESASPACASPNGNATTKENP